MSVRNSSVIKDSNEGGRKNDAEQCTRFLTIIRWIAGRLSGRRQRRQSPFVLPLVYTGLPFHWNKFILGICSVVAWA